jgi:hypothetical protein
VLTEADFEIMREAYGQCSIWEHYQPAAGNIPQPSADDLAEEATRLADWFRSIQARQKTVR